MKNSGGVGFIYHFEKIRDGRVVKNWRSHNVMTTSGLEYILDAAMSGGSQITAFYVTVFKGSHQPVFSDTYAVPGFSELTTEVNESARQIWAEDGVTGKKISSAAAKASYTFTTAVTVTGAALCGGGTAPSVKGDTAGGGKLISAAAAAPEEFESGETLTVWAEMTITEVV